MPELTLVLDLGPVEVETRKIAKTLESKLATAAQHLAIQAHAHVLDEASSKLKSRFDIFKKNFVIEKIDRGVYSVVVKSEARWIEDGQEPHSMLEYLLKSPKAKRAKDGSKYLIVPFKHNVAPSRSTETQTQLRDILRSELKKKDISYQKIERNPDGSAKLGLLHKMDIKTPDHLKSPRGDPEGRPYLWGLRIYQNIKKNDDGSTKLDKHGQPAIARDIFTFRVASSKHEGSKWFHPGSEPMHFLDDAYEWAKRKWDEEIAPQILSELEVDNFKASK
jgi:uncharacterized protein YajQ (UPF0234 family)